MKFETAEMILEQAIADKQTPGAVLRIETSGQLLYEKAIGLRHTSPRLPMLPDTIFDVASLTKVTSTLGIVLTMFNQQMLKPDTCLGDILPVSDEQKTITIQQCLSHTGGFPASARLQHSINEVYTVPLAYSPGSQVIYSDLGFLLLGQVIEQITGTSLQNLIHKYTNQWGMPQTDFNPAHRESCAATEWRDWLGRHQWGEVHDEKASLAGGVAGHAGLFSTAKDLARYASLYLHPEQDDWFFRSRLCTTEGLNERRGLGWVLSQPGCFGGKLASDGAFGHTGFTGTSLWIDPLFDLVIVLLTNRVHFGRDTQINTVRERVHVAVYEQLKSHS